VKQIYSVYDYPTRRFRYFSAPLGVVPASGGFRTPRTVSGVVIPESVAMRVPHTAVPVGTGTEARGLVATLGEAEVEPHKTNVLPKTIVPVLVGLGVLWWLWRRGA